MSLNETQLSILFVDRATREQIVHLLDGNLLLKENNATIAVFVLSGI